MNPAGIALGAANPGLMPLAFMGSGGGYHPSSGSGCLSVIAAVLVATVLGVALWFSWQITLLILGGIAVVVSAIGGAFALAFAVDELTDSIFLSFLTLSLSLGAWVAAGIAVLGAIR